MEFILNPSVWQMVTQDWPFLQQRQQRQLWRVLHSQMTSDNAKGNGFPSHLTLSITILRLQIRYGDYKVEWTNRWADKQSVVYSNKGKLLSKKYKDSTVSTYTYNVVEPQKYYPKQKTQKNTSCIIPCIRNPQRGKTDLQWWKAD